MLRWGRSPLMVKGLSRLVDLIKSLRETRGRIDLLFERLAEVTRIHLLVCVLKEGIIFGIRD